MPHAPGAPVPPSEPTAPRVRLLGVEVDPLTPRSMLDTADRLLKAGGVAVIANHNAHSLYLFRKSAELRAFYARCERIQVDSTPMLIWARLMGLPLSRANRSTYLDWKDMLWERSTREGWRVFHIGGAPGVPEAAREAILKRWPDVQLEVRNGYFDANPNSEDSVRLRAEIAAYDPDILLIGMGMPRQEFWIDQNRDLLARGVIFPTGAAFDYEAGVQVEAPRWMGRLGIEWAFRLISQPLRLGQRYLVEPWFLIPNIVDDLKRKLGSGGKA